MTFSTRLPLKCFVLAVLIVGLFAAPGAARATAPSGTVVAWGCSADAGQCSVPSGLSGVTAVAAGFYHSLASKSDGTVVAWGCQGGFDFGQCSVPSGLSDVTAVAAGFAHSLALKRDGTIVAWGCGNGNDHGQCSVPSGLSDVTAIAAGMAHSLALKADGTVVAWGCGGGFDYGQCSVPNGLSDVTAIAGSFTQSLALESGWHRGLLGLRHRELRSVQRAEWPLRRDRDRGRLLPRARLGKRRHRGRLGLRRRQRQRAVRRSEWPVRRDRGHRKLRSQPGLEERRHRRRLGLRQCSRRLRAVQRAERPLRRDRRRRRPPSQPGVGRTLKHAARHSETDGDDLTAGGCGGVSAGQGGDRRVQVCRQGVRAGVMCGHPIVGREPANQWGDEPRHLDVGDAHDHGNGTTRPGTCGRS